MDADWEFVPSCSNHNDSPEKAQPDATTHLPALQEAAAMEVDPLAPDPFAINMTRYWLRSPGTMLPGDVIMSPDGESRAILQEDGNFVVYRGRDVMWASGTHEGNPLGLSKASELHAQADGNLVLLDATNTPAWSSKTARPTYGSYVLLVTNDGQLVWKEDASDTTSGEVLFKAGARG